MSNAKHKPGTAANRGFDVIGQGGEATVIRRTDAGTAWKIYHDKHGALERARHEFSLQRKLSQAGFTLVPMARTFVAAEGLDEHGLPSSVITCKGNAARVVAAIEMDFMPGRRLSSEDLRRPDVCALVANTAVRTGEMLNAVIPKRGIGQKPTVIHHLRCVLDNTPYSGVASGLWRIVEDGIARSRPVLIHGDLHSNQMLFVDDEGTEMTCSAVLDWGGFTVGPRWLDCCDWSPATLGAAFRGVLTPEEERWAAAAALVQTFAWSTQAQRRGDEAAVRRYLRALDDFSVAGIPAIEPLLRSGRSLAHDAARASGIVV